MKNYENKEDKIKDVRSTGYTFCLVGGLGIIFLVVLNLNLLPIHLVSSSKILVTVVMGLVFLIFIGIGLWSFLSLKKIAAEADAIEDKNQEVIDYVLDHHTDDLKELSCEEEEKEERYFIRSQKILEYINEKFELSDEELDFLVEEIYNRIYEN